LRAEEEERHKGLPTQKRKCFIKSAPGLEAGVEVAEPGHRLVREVHLETAVLPLLKMFRAPNVTISLALFRLKIQQVMHKNNNFIGF
jgi:hypothetical protein